MCKVGLYYFTSFLSVAGLFDRYANKVRVGVGPYFYPFLSRIQRRERREAVGRKGRCTREKRGIYPRRGVLLRPPPYLGYTLYGNQGTI